MDVSMPESPYNKCISTPYTLQFPLHFILSFSLLCKSVLKSVSLSHSELHGPRFQWDSSPDSILVIIRRDSIFPTLAILVPLERQWHRLYQSSGIYCLLMCLIATFY